MNDLQSRVSKMTQALLTLGNGEDRVKSAVVGIDWEGHGQAAAAAGISRADTGAPMRVETQFHIASVGKPMTAALIFQAVEEGKLGPEGVDARLIDTGVLPPDICRRLHIIDTVSYSDQITVRHLLTHTSGLRDAQIDDSDMISEGYGGRPAPNSIIGRRAHDLRLHVEAVAERRKPDASLLTNKHWIPWDPARPTEAEAGLINFYLNNGGMADHALFKPGEAFHYSDTAYTILGLLAERLFGASYHHLLRSRIFDPLGMNDSYLDAHSDLAPSPWVREVSDCWSGSVPMLSYGISLSNDWGGGGQVCTAGDLNRFIKGLLAGRLFRSKTTLLEMLRWSEPKGSSEHFAKVGCGIFTLASSAGLEIIGHSGAWGAKMLAVPALGMVLSGTVNRRGAKAEWMIEIAEALAA